MTPEQVEKEIIELKHHEPFAPFVVDLADGQSLQLTDPGIAINGGGATFFGPDGALVDYKLIVYAMHCPDGGNVLFAPEGVSRLLDLPVIEK